MHRPLFALLILGISVCGVAEPTRWYEVRSPHFDVFSDASERRARETAGHLEEMRALFRAELPGANDEGDLPIEVFALANNDGMRALEPTAYLAKGSLELGGLFNRSLGSNTILLRLDASGLHPLSAVYHEYTHYMLRKAAAWLPLWMNEGLAEFYQNTDIDGRDVVVGRPSSSDVEYLRRRELIPLPTLLKVNHQSPYYHNEEKGSVFYSESWALIHFLEISDSDHNTHFLSDYATYLIKGEDAVGAANHAFGDLGALQKSLDDYVTRLNFKAFRLKLPTVGTLDLASFQAVPVKPDDMDARRAGVLTGTGRSKDAEAMLQAVLQRAPDNALAHEKMGELKLRLGDMDAARRFYGEAVKLNPESPMANYWYATLLLQKQDHTEESAIETGLRKTIQLQPNFPPGYAELATLYLRQNKNLTEAMRLITRAIHLEPETLTYRIQAANILIAAKQYSGAEKVLEAARPLATHPGEAQMLEDHIGEAKGKKEAGAQ